MDPDQAAPLGAVLIMFHIVCFHEKNLSDALVICSRRKKQTTFSEQKIVAGLIVIRQDFNLFINTDGLIH